MRRIFYSDLFTLPLPEGHRFPMTKYRELRDRLVNEGWLAPDELSPSPLATREELILAHTPNYVDAITTGSIDPAIIRAVGFPWSEQLVKRSEATVGGCIAAARWALDHGISGQLAGGTHHAHADRGSGYCVYNDIAVATRVLQIEKKAKRIAIIDLDVHQGDGNSAILGQDPSVFILSLHGEKNFPFRKVASTLDIGLENETTDEQYLNVLDQALEKVWQFSPDFIFYQSGVDPLVHDKLGKLSLTFEGLEERDRRVLSAAKNRGIPLSIAMGGGYADPIALTVQAHVGTYKVVKELYPPT